jgi:hypothetical protein
VFRLWLKTWGWLRVRTKDAPLSPAQTARTAQAGLGGLTDALLGMVVAAMLLPTVAQLTNQQSQTLRDQVAAQQLRAFSDATAAFIKNNFASLYTNMGTGSGDYVALAQLTQGGYLPASFSQTNAYGQTMSALLRRVQPTGTICTSPPSCAQLIEAVVVTTGGTVLDKAHAANVATLAGAHAGLITDAGTAHGVYATWCIDFSRFGGATHTSCTVTDPPTWTSVSDAIPTTLYGKPAAGGLASAMFFNGAEMISEYLNRFNTGNVEDNTMHTNLNMGDNDIDNARTVIISGVTQTASGGGPQGLDVNRMNMINDLWDGNYTANSGNLSATSFNATAQMTAPTYADAANPTGFYVKPAGASQIDSLAAAGDLNSQGNVYGKHFYLNP